MTILLLGSGAREHALAWKLIQSPFVERIVCAPGNPGIAGIASVVAAEIEQPDQVVNLARTLNPDLVFIGPEQPLAAGVSDALRQIGYPVFGPSRAAARLEWDKAYAKDFMGRHDIPTAVSRTFTAAELEEGCAYLESHSTPVVLKASGLAAGKGVVIAATSGEAVTTLKDMLSGAAFGSAGHEVVVEEFMEGEEASIFAVTDGVDYVTLAPSQDHKRIGTGDTGPNTGGMGAYAPAPLVTDEVMERVRRRIIEPVLKGMAAGGAPYSGCLFVGLMIRDGQPRVVEFNSRFGDPETQVVLPLYTGDFAELALAAATGRIGTLSAASSRGSAVCIVMSAEGYPGAVRRGDPITGIESACSRPAIQVFHAGTALKDGVLVTSGGRVLGVTAISGDDDMTGTIARAYQAVGDISFAGAHYRTDIGSKR